jgi:hypothetical protein
MRRSPYPLTLAAVTALALAAPAGAAPVAIGGVDARSQYTYSAGVGIYTFDDTATSLPGTVTTESGIAGLIGGRITLEIKLDTASFNPATDGVLNARFIGTGPGSEIMIWDAALLTVLLSLDVDYIEVTQKAFGGGSSILVGLNLVEDLGVSSYLTVTGGTLAGDVGGIGTPAVIKLLLNRPQPALTTGNQAAYFSQSLITVGNGYAPTSASNWDLLIIPEPGTALLIGLGLVALAHGRRGTR